MYFAIFEGIFEYMTLLYVILRYLLKAILYVMSVCCFNRIIFCYNCK